MCPFFFGFMALMKRDSLNQVSRQQVWSVLFVRKQSDRMKRPSLLAWDFKWEIKLARSFLLASEKRLIRDRLSLTRYKKFSQSEQRSDSSGCLSLFQLCSSQQSKLYAVGAVGLPAAPAETQIIVFTSHLSEQHLARFKPTTKQKWNYLFKKSFSAGIINM